MRVRGLLKGVPPSVPFVCGGYRRFPFSLSVSGAGVERSGER